MKKILLIIGSTLLILLFANPFGRLYSFFIVANRGFSGFFLPEFWGNFIDGLPLSYTFFLTLLFTAFGGAKKYWWIGIGLIPALAFELYFDLEHIYFPVVIGLLGWLIGYGLGMVVTKKTTQS